MSLLPIGATPPLIPGDANFESIQSISQHIYTTIETTKVITEVVTGLLPPVNGTDAVNKDYVDSYALNSSWKAPVRCATTNNITLAGTGQFVDGILLINGDRVLVKNQINTAENGIYDVSIGPWFRSSDAALGSPATGVYVYVKTGVINQTKLFVCQTLSTMFGLPLTFTEFTSGGGGSTPGGPTNGSIQFNNGGVLDGSSNFLWSGSTLNVTGLINTTDIQTNSMTSTDILTTNIQATSITTGILNIPTSGSINMSTSSSITFDGSTGKILGLPSVATDPSEATSKAYVDAQIGSTPGGAEGSIQYNNGSLFTGDSNFKWIGSSATLIVSGAINTSGVFTSTNTADSISPVSGSFLLAGGLGVSGTIHAAGNVYANAFFSTSDIMCKTEIKPLYNSIDILNKIECCSYKLIGQDELNYGVLAQQLDMIGLDNLVNKTDKFKSVNYTQLIALLINSIQDLHSELEDMKKMQKIYFNMSN